MLYLVSVIVLVVVVGAWGIAFLLTRKVEQRIADVEADIAGLEASLNSRRDDVRSIVLFTRRLSVLEERLNTHLGWSRVLGELERLTTPPVVFRELSGSVETSTVTAEVSVPTLDAAADLIASLQQVPGLNDSPFRQVDVDSISRVEGQEAEEHVVSLRLIAPHDVFTVRPGVP